MQRLSAFVQFLIYGAVSLYFLCPPVRSETTFSNPQNFPHDELLEKIQIKIDSLNIVVDAKVLAPRQQKASPVLLILPFSEGLFAQESRALGFDVAVIDLDRLPEKIRSRALYETALKLQSLTKTKILLGFVDTHLSENYIQNARLFDGLLVREVDLQSFHAISAPIIHFWGEDAYWRLVPWRGIWLNKKNIREFFISGETSSSVSLNCRKDENAFGMMAAQKALLTALYAWVLGETPPASRAPGPRDVILAKDLIWPDIGVAPMRPKDDRLVPKIDHDGNTHSGVQLPNHVLPIATFVGIPLHHDATDSACFAPTIAPFSADKSAREKSHDPRLSLVERYGSRTYFVATMRIVADRLVKEKLLLAQDADAYVRAAKAAPF